MDYNILRTIYGINAEKTEDSIRLLSVRHLTNYADATMNLYSNHYRSGEEIRAGDRILWAGKPGRVLFVLGSSEVPVDWAALIDKLGKEGAKGFMLDTAIAGPVFQYESDEDLEFVGRTS